MYIVAVAGQPLLAYVVDISGVEVRRKSCNSEVHSFRPCRGFVVESCSLSFKVVVTGLWALSVAGFLSPFVWIHCLYCSSLLVVGVQSLFRFFIWIQIVQAKGSLASSLLWCNSFAYGGGRSRS